LISIENFYLVEKQNKEENFVKKFVESGFVKTCDEFDLWLKLCSHHPELSISRANQ
jgi:hypothetical protein